MAHLMAQIDVSNEDRGAFSAALVNAEVGDEIIYHIGEWAAGNHKGQAMAAYEAGLCVLYQRKEGPRQFAYIAKKVRHRKKQ
jgi:hypothetical protein